MEDYSITLNDSNNLEVIEKDYSYIVIKNIPTSSMTYDNPYEIYWNKIGYYINDNGDPVYLDARVKINKIMLKWVDGISDSNYSYYAIGRVNSQGFDLVGRAYDSSFHGYSSDMGAHTYFSIDLFDDNGQELSSDIADSLYLQWTLSDLDVGDSTVIKNRSIFDNNGETPEFVESIKFNTGFDDKFYVLKDTVLKITENNRKFTGTEGTVNENDPNTHNQKTRDYSTVIAYQFGPSATAEWWGCECGTTLAAIFGGHPYPKISNPIKSVDGDIYSVGERVSYTINETFPYTDSYSKAKSFELSDTFDNALKINEVTYQVFDANNKDVTSDWEKNISGQTVSLKYIGEDTATVYGKFTFKFNNLIVLDPDSKHEIKKENGLEYKIVPNKALVTIVDSNDEISTKETNTVNIRVGDPNNPSTGVNFVLIVGIIMIIFIGSISTFRFVNKKKSE